MFKKILALYDLSTPSRHALEWAFRFATAFGASFRVATVLGPEEGGGEAPRSEEEAEERIRDDVDRVLRKMLKTGRLSGHPDLKIDVLAGAPAVRLLKTIEETSPDLVVMGSHGRTGLSRVLLGSVAERIVRHSPAPVFVARGEPAWPPKKILAPVDFDESAEEALLLASEIRRVLPVRVELVHVVVPPAPLAYGAEAAVALPVFDEKAARREAQVQLDAMTARHPSLAGKTHVAAGQPAAEIRRKALETGADLILIPTHGRSGLPRLLMGSVAEQTVRYAPCGVLAFSPKKMAEARRESVRALSENGSD